MTDRTFFLVFTNPTEGMEDEYNRWYDEQHLRDVVAVPGVVAAQRYELVHPGPPGGAAPTHKYLALYEIEGDPDPAVNEMASRFLTDQMPGTEALDLAATSMAVWSARGPRLEA